MNDLIKSENALMENSNAREISKAVEEVQAALVIAKKFPRHTQKAITRINEACTRRKLAESAMYAYSRGGTMITGPSIRLAEVLAQNWGNLDFGIRELSNENGESVVEAFCWDMETNVRQTKVFRVKHERNAKGRINKLFDPRDIYEHIANYGARRLRACILGVIPGDIVDDALERCQKTLEAGGGEPLADRIKKMALAFKELGVDIGMLEDRLGHKLEVTIEAELVALGKIFNSLRDGMSKREDWFKFDSPKSSEKSDALNEKFKGEAKES